MASKPTSLAAHVAKEEELQRKKEAAIDAQTAKLTVPEGKVWARLIRAHYDRDGVYHEPGIALIYADAVPESATVLTVKEVKEQELTGSEDRPDDGPGEPTKVATDQTNVGAGGPTPAEIAAKAAEDAKAAAAKK